jgi:hypothetical protein
LRQAVSKQAKLRKKITLGLDSNGRQQNKMLKLNKIARVTWNAIWARELLLKFPEERCQFMKILASLFTLVLLAASAGIAQADSVPPGDPKIILAGAGNSTPVDELFFFGSDDFQTPSEGNPFIDFQNVSGNNFDNLTITILNAAFPGGDLTCGVTAFFSSCTADPDGKFVRYFGTNNDNFTGIGSGSAESEFAFFPSFFSESEDEGGNSHFQLQFVGFQPDPNNPLEFQGQANVATPEPSVALLCAVGLLGLAVFSKKLRSVATNRA